MPLTRLRRSIPSIALLAAFLLGALPPATTRGTAWSTRVAGRSFIYLPVVLRMYAVIRYPLAFVRSDGGTDIYVLNPSATQTNLTNTPDEDEEYPAWSPDGTRLAFDHNDTFGSINVINADGSGRTNLTPTEGGWRPIWSPDGQKLAFQSWFHNIPRNTVLPDIHVMHADGSGRTNLTNTLDEAEYAPTWSPDGIKLAFSSVPIIPAPHSQDIHVMHADGSGRMNLTNTLDEEEYEPAWSPDGIKLAFSSEELGPRPRPRDIYVMNADGTGKMSLTNTPSETEADPAWSPDGTKLAFTSVRLQEGPLLYDIYVMNADGSGRINLTNTPHEHESELTWSPDGKQLAYRGQTGEVSDGTYNFEIYVMNADGSGKTNLTNTPDQWERYPVWSSRSGSLGIVGGQP